LIFFSTEAGDAWMLDTEHSLALCLARDGAPREVQIVETENNFAIGWEQTFQIDGEVFTVTHRSGRITSVFGYPTKEIANAMRRTN
jgi:hypothetical protein